MKIAVLGINHKLAPLPLREAITRAFTTFFSKTTPFFSASFVLLDTCNRTELYFSSEDIAQSHTTILEFLKKELPIDFDQKLYSFFFHECFLHLAKVTAGLDSALVGETEIQGQVKNAYEKARTENALCFDLHYLFQKCLKIGKDARKSIHRDFSLASLDLPILSIAEIFFSDLRKPSFLLVGASEVNKKLLTSLLQKGCHVTVANRTDTKALLWKKTLPIQTLTWKELCSWPDFDIVITATHSREYLIKPMLGKKIRTKLFIDLAVPRNIDPKLARTANTKLFHIDRLQKLAKKNQKQTKSFVEEAEEFIAQKIMLYLKLYRKRQTAQATGLKLFEESYTLFF